MESQTDRVHFLISRDGQAIRFKNFDDYRVTRLELADTSRKDWLVCRWGSELLALVPLDMEQETGWNEAWYNEKILNRWPDGKSFVGWCFQQLLAGGTIEYSLSEKETHFQVIPENFISKKRQLNGFQHCSLTSKNKNRW